MAVWQYGKFDHNIFFCIGWYQSSFIVWIEQSHMTTHVLVCLQGTAHEHTVECTNWLSVQFIFQLIAQPLYTTWEHPLQHCSSVIPSEFQKSSRHPQGFMFSDDSLCPEVIVLSLTGYGIGCRMYNLYDVLLIFTWQIYWLLVSSEVYANYTMPQWAQR